MKSIRVLLSFLGIIIVAVGVYYSIQQLAMTNELELQQTQRMHDDTRAEVVALKQLVQSLRDSMGTWKVESDLAREAQLYSVRDTLETVLSTQDNDKLNELRSQLDSILASGSVFDDRTLLAQDAFDRAESANRYGNSPLAEVYYLSAINHAPSEYRFVKAYAEHVLGKSAPTLEELAQLRSILQISTFQVLPANIEELLTIDSRAEAKELEILAAEEPVMPGIDWQVELDSLKVQETLNDSWADQTTLVNLTTSLSDAVGALSVEAPESPLLQRATNELMLSQRVLQAISLASTLDSLTARLNVVIDDKDKAAYLVPTLQSTLAELLAMDSTDFPKELQTKIDDYVPVVSDLLERANDAYLREPLEKIASLVEQAKRILDNNPVSGQEYRGPRGLIQEKFEVEFIPLKQEIYALSSSLPGAASRTDLNVKLQELQDVEDTLEQWQSDAYQKYALHLTKEAVKFYESTSPLNDEHARQVFKDAKLATFDVYLLSPDVRDVFVSIRTIVISELPAQEQRQLQITIAQTPKLRLEDF